MKAHEIKNFKHQIGVNCLVTTLRDVVAYNGYDLSEDIILGLSGAFSFWYAKSPQYMQATGIGSNIFEEFAAVTKVHHFTDKIEDNETAWNEARKLVEHDIPVILETALAVYAQYLEESGSKKQILNFHNSIDFLVGGHVTCLLGYDENEAILSENLFYEPVKISLEILKKARNPKEIEFVAPKNRMHAFYFPERLPEMDYLLDTAMIRVITNMENSYYKEQFEYGAGYYKLSGLKGISSMFDDILDIYSEKTEAGIRQLFALEKVLNRWGGNEVNRVNYSRFLTKVAEERKDENIKNAAYMYIEASKEWKTFLKIFKKQLERNEFSEPQYIMELKSIILEREKRALDYLHKATKY